MRSIRVLSVERERRFPIRTYAAMLLLLVTLCLLVPFCATAQRTTASIAGTIMDSSGASLPKAEVVAVETATGTSTRNISDPQGSYVLSNLNPGQYKLQVQAPGFRSFTQDGILLTVGQAASINVTMIAGGASESITVTSEASQVNLRSQELETVITPEMARQLPLNGRNVLQLMTLAPDVSPAVPSGSYSYYNQEATRPESSAGFISANGGRANSGSYYLDGGINEDPFTQVANVFPNPDAIQEFSYITNSYSAKFGGHGGGVVNAVTRGGTNDFHGTAYDFVRNGSLNATNFFALKNDGLKRNQYGASIGGPIRKNSTFFFFSWQGTKLRSRPSTSESVTATAAERSGDFSEISTQLVDPFTGVPFKGNQIPVGQFDPAALALSNLTPVGAPGTGLVFYETNSQQNGDQFVTRVDQNFGSKLRIYGRYLYDKLELPSPSIKGNILTAGTDTVYKSNNVALNAAYNFNNNLVATATGTFNRDSVDVTGPSFFPSFTDLGVKVQDLCTGQAPTLGFSVSGYFGAFYSCSYKTPRGHLGFNTNWSWTAGRHEVEFGGELTRESNPFSQDFVSDGYYGFGSQQSGNNLVDFLLGKPDFFEQGAPFAYKLERVSPALFVNDNWKVSRRLTLSLGVRWSPWLPFQEQTADQTVVYSEIAYNAGTVSKRYPTLPPGLLVGGDPGVPKAGIRSFYDVFDPRVGIAYDPFGDGKTSIRAGFGIYQDQPIGVGYNNMADEASFNLFATVPFPGSFGNPYSGQTDPFPGTFPLPPTQIFPLPAAPTGFSPSMVPPTIMQWNVTTERQLTSNLVARAAYEASEAYHLYGGDEANPATYIPGNSTFENVQARRPKQQYTNIISVQTAGTSSFNALVLTLEKRLSRGLSLTGGFRWSKSLDEISQSNVSHVDYTKPNDKGFDRGPSDFDIGKQYTLSYVWQLPAFQRLGTVGKSVLGDWSLNGIFNAHSGFPYTVLSGQEFSYTGNASGKERADLIGNPNLSGGRPQSAKLQEWFNTDAFTFNAAGTFGNSSRNSYAGPGAVNFDLGVVKSFPIRVGHFAESQKVDFKTEFFNLPNKPNFQNPDNAKSDTTTFGMVLNAQDPRIIQFSLKYSF